MFERIFCVNFKELFKKEERTVFETKQKILEFRLAVGRHAVCCNPGALGHSAIPTCATAVFSTSHLLSRAVDLEFNNGDIANNDTNYSDKSNPIFYHGGDLKGIINQVDYLKKLGITSIWITPFVENVIIDSSGSGYHGYWAHDFTAADKHWTSAENQDNTNARLNYIKTFVETMHNNGILVIQDVVVNHMGNHSLYKINNAEEWNPPFSLEGYGDSSHLFLSDSSYKDADWVLSGLRTKPPVPFDKPSFYNNCGPISNFLGDEQILGDLPEVDDLRTSSTEVKESLIKIYSDWIKNIHVDGFRIDTVKHVEETFWDEFCPAIRAIAGSQNKKFIQFGEAFLGDHNLTTSFLSNQRLDSLLNFDLHYRMIDVFRNYAATSNISAEINTRKTVLRNTKITMGGGEIDAIEGAVNFLDNHDEARFLNVSTVPLEKYWNALTFLLTAQGIPCIYYNSENDTIGISSIDGRKDMPDFNTTGKKTLTLLRKLIKIRKDNIALRRGGIEVLKDFSGTGILVFVRNDQNNPEENVFVLFNTSDSPINETIPLKSYSERGDTLKNILYSEFGITEIFKVNNNKEITVTIGPNSSKILKK